MNNNIIFKIHFFSVGDDSSNKTKQNGQRYMCFVSGGLIDQMASSNNEKNLIKLIVTRVQLYVDFFYSNH